MNSSFNQEPKFDRAASVEAMFAGKLLPDILSGAISKLPLNNDEEIKKILSDKFKRHPKFPEVDLDEIIKELKKVKDIFEPVAEKIKKPKLEPEHIGIELPENRLTEIKDEKLEKRAKIYIDKEEIEKQKKFIFENKVVINELFKKSEEILSADVNTEDYIKADLYLKEEVDFHNREVKKYETLFDQKNTLDEKETKKLATIFEAIVIEGVNLSKCFGEDVMARASAPYDNICETKIDSYLLLKNIPLGIDVSMRNINGEAFTEKIEKNLRMIQNNEKKGIKYFKDSNGELKRDVFAPKVVISCNTSMIRDLMFDFKNLDKDKFSEKLKSHQMSREIVKQVIGQCRIFAEYAKYKKQNKVADYYTNILLIINKISEESLILKRLMIGAGSDVVSMRIQEIVNKFKEKEIDSINELQEYRDSKKKAA